MPELTVVHIAMLAGTLLLGFILGWIYRSGRSTREKKSINAGWQAQIDSQQSEHDRLADQNKSLMEQISQYQASNSDSKNRARELSDSPKEAFSRRDELQRQMKDIRGNLEVAIAQRDKLQTSASQDESLATSLEEKDVRIEKLGKELDNWQKRVPPLVERYRERDLEAQQLEVELQKAQDHIASLEGMTRGEHTHIEPVDSSTIPDGLDASNEPHTSTSILDPVDLEAKEYEDLEDQVDETVDEAEDKPSPVELPEDWQDHDATGVSQDIDSDEDGNSSNGEAGDDSLEVAEPATGEVFPNVLDDKYATDIHGPDDLRQIKGIGPAIEKTLNDLGIHRFNQIAEMSEYDIDRVAQQLKGFRSRIYREDWIGQARTLQQQKNSD